MQPSAIIIPRAELQTSAPSASSFTMRKPDVILPLAITVTRSRTPNPTRALCTKIRLSISGEPMWSENSSGAAPVPPSAPSTLMKSGRMPVRCMALQIARNSRRLPTHSLSPTGLPSASSRRRATNSSSPTGVENVAWPGGEITSRPSGTPRMRAISGETFAAGRMPPWPGLAPCDNLISIILTDGRPAFS